MLLKGTPVTVDQDGATLPVEDIAPGQTLWNPLTRANVAVASVLTHTPRADRPLSVRLMPHLLSPGALGPGRPDRPLRVLPGMHCLRPVKGPGGRVTLEPAALGDLCPELVRAIGPGHADDILIPLPEVSSVILLCGLLVCLDLTLPVEPKLGGNRILPAH